MIDRARAYFLLLQENEVEELKRLANKFDKLNDSRHGLGGYYRYQPRDFAFLYAADARRLSVIADVGYAWRLVTKGRHAQLADIHPPPLIHESVFRRIKAGVDGYSPIVLPAKYEVTTKDGRIIDPATYQRTPQDDSLAYEQPGSARTRAIRQERVWDLVWKRRIVYFATVFCSAFLALMPVLPLPKLGSGSVLEFLIPIIGLAGKVLPGLAAPWLDSFKAAPGYFAIATAVIGGLLYVSGGLQGRSRDTMRPLWLKSLAAPVGTPESNEKPGGWIYGLRTHPLYRVFFIALTHWLLPSLVALTILITGIYGFLVIGNRVVFFTENLFGGVCSPSAEVRPVAAKSGPVNFDTTKLCNPSGLLVTKGATYQVTFTTTVPWEDGHRAKEAGIPTDPRGFGREKMTGWMWLGLPFRRYISVNWFQPIVRIGSKGMHEQPLTFEPQPTTPNRPAFTATFKPRADGEAFFFVNDSVGAPGFTGLFYANNQGQAEITIEKVEPK
jgi:hypothetical protein